jgi:hypothetical protein
MDRPIRVYGGPSPHMRALANQEVLTLSSFAASFGVSRSPIAVAGKEVHVIVPNGSWMMPGTMDRLIIIATKLRRH